MSTIDSAGINAQIPLQAKYPDIGGTISDNMSKAFELQDLYKQRQLQQQQLQFQNQATMQKLGMEHEQLQIENKRLDAQQALVNAQYQGQVSSARSEWMSDQMANVYDVYARAKQKAKAAGADDQAAEQAAQAEAGPLLKQVKAAAPDAKGPRGEPLFDQPTLQRLGQAPDTFNMDKIGPMLAQNPKALQRKLAVDKELLDERKADAVQKRQDALTTQGERRLDVAERQADTAAKREEDMARNIASLVKSRGEGGFEGKAGELLGALAEKGVSLPAGLRSKAQMSSTLKNLVDRNPDLTPDQIADKIAAGQIEFGAEKKETQIAAGQAGKIAVAQNEIKEFAPLVLDASAKVPRTSFVPINKLMQMGEASISDPNLKRLKVYINTLDNAYDQLAARGGTDKEKRKENRSNLMAADSPETLKVAIDAYMMEAAAAERAAAKAMKPPGKGDAESTAPAQPKVVDWGSLK